jgi:hypothetical protein
LKELVENVGGIVIQQLNSVYVRRSKWNDRRRFVSLDGWPGEESPLRADWVSVVLQGREHFTNLCNWRNLIGIYDASIHRIPEKRSVCLVNFERDVWLSLVESLFPNSTSR